MGRAFHAARTHGRVFHGVEARNMLALHRRDSHGSQLHNHIPAEVDNKMNFIHNNPNARLQGKQNDVAVETVESVVYVTMPQSFEGDAGMSTADSAATSTMDAAASYAQAKGMAGQPQPVTSAVVSAAAEVSTSVNNGPVANTRASSSPTLQTVPTQVSDAKWLTMC